MNLVHVISIAFRHHLILAFYTCRLDFMSIHQRMLDYKSCLGYAYIASLFTFK